MGRHYRKCKDPVTGRRKRSHRVIAARLLGRPLLSTEVVHHRDGNRNNNAPENLLVLSSAAAHSSLEARLKRRRRGQPTLFPDLLEDEGGERVGTLFERLG
jgi:hypothetical protein